MNDGFPRGVQFTPVPDPLLASLLESIDSLPELKVTLRAIHWLHKKRRVPASISINDLLSDRTVSAMLDADSEELEKAVSDALSSASDRGVFILTNEKDSVRIYLNTEPVRRALANTDIEVVKSTYGANETWPSVDAAQGKDSISKLFEQNIGPITPFISENLRNALESHPADEVQLAIRKAAEANARSWNYIAAILRTWAVEGRPEELDDGPDETAERDLQEDRSDRFYEEYLERQRARGAR